MQINGGLLLGALVLLCIIVLIVIGARHRRWLDQHGVNVSATVTSIKRGSDSDGDTYYVVAAQWTDPRTHSTYAFRKRRSRRPRYSEGSQIHVVINPNKPRDYYMKD